jgi:hypothetical protein
MWQGIPHIQASIGDSNNVPWAVRGAYQPEGGAREWRR